MRNRIRRRVYETLRQNFESIPKKRDYIFVIFSAKVLKMSQKELESLLGGLVENSKMCYTKKRYE